MRLIVIQGLHEDLKGLAGKESSEPGLYGGEIREDFACSQHDVCVLVPETAQDCWHGVVLLEQGRAWYISG